MTGSTSSQQRAQLIREMSKDMNRTRTSESSQHSRDLASPHPTVSDFDPENEAIMSTRQLDNNAQQLPGLRASAQKYSRFTRPEPDFAINTSAIGRAFPDFSQGGTSSDDDSLSIEIGRGLKIGSNSKVKRLNEYSSNAHMSLDGDSMDFSAPMIGDYRVTGTPPLTQRHSSGMAHGAARGSLRRDVQARKPSGLQKETTGPSPPPPKTKDYGSGESRKGSDENRRTLSSMHARIGVENEQSTFSEERPPTLDLTARNTRFGNVKGQQNTPDEIMPTKFTSKQGLLQSLVPKKKQKSQTVATPPQGTQQSFMLPDLPNISELVSGVYEDGTPVFSRHGKPRASRFISASGNLSKGQNYIGVNEIPVPADEQAIFLSLKLLQDKVATLEKTNGEAENVIQELQQKTRLLEGEKSNRRRRPRSDSALDTTDSDGGNELGASQRKLLIEKNRLETSVRALQGQLDNSNRKTSTTETILRNISQERDSAISQLGVAYFTIEQLKGEVEGLKGENDELKTRLAQLSNDHKNESQASAAKDEALRQRLDRRPEAGQSIVEETRVEPPKLPERNVPKIRQTESTGRGMESSTHRDANTMFDLHQSRKDIDEYSKDGQRTVQMDDYQDSDDSVSEASKAKGKGRADLPRNAKSVQDEPSQNLTYLSFLESDEIAKLRRTLEQERLQRKQRRSRELQPDDKADTIEQIALPRAQAKQPKQLFPRKSSMKDTTSRSTNQNDVNEPSPLPGAQTEHNRRHSETSILSTRSRRRGLDTENMTSAFIVPDITIRNPDIQSVPNLPKEAQNALKQLATHDGQNCVVCKRTIGHDEHHEHGDTARQAVKILKPVPVSERIPKSNTFEEEPTIRPAQAPGLALAIVMKGLEDELAHLKIDLGQYQALYNGHDPALSKRKRKSVYHKIETLLQAIDVKADQIYALYDVLEGQKQDGHEISEEEVEITLESVGIDPAGLHLRGGGVDEIQEDEKEGPSERQPWDLDSDGGSEDDLPWEGIEATVETAKSGFGGPRRSSGA